MNFEFKKGTEICNMEKITRLIEYTTNIYDRPQY